MQSEKVMKNRSTIKSTGPIELPLGYSHVHRVLSPDATGKVPK